MAHSTGAATATAAHSAIFPRGAVAPHNPRQAQQQKDGESQQLWRTAASHLFRPSAGVQNDVALARVVPALCARKAAALLAPMKLLQYKLLVTMRSEAQCGSVDAHGTHQFRACAYIMHHIGMLPCAPSRPASQTDRSAPTCSRRGRESCQWGRRVSQACFV